MVVACVEVGLLGEEEAHLYQEGSWESKSISIMYDTWTVV